MEKVLLAAALSLLLGLSLAGTTTAQAVPYTAGNQSNLIAQLEPMVEICDWKVRTLTGEPKEAMLLHNTKMKKLLGELKASRSVDPMEIDEVMKKHALESGQLLSY